MTKGEATLDANGSKVETFTQVIGGEAVAMAAMAPPAVQMRIDPATQMQRCWLPDRPPPAAAKSQRFARRP